MSAKPASRQAAERFSALRPGGGGRWSGGDQSPFHAAPSHRSWRCRQTGGSGVWTSPTTGYGLYPQRPVGQKRTPSTPCGLTATVPLPTVGRVPAPHPRPYQPPLGASTRSRPGPRGHSMCRQPRRRAMARTHRRPPGNRQATAITRRAHPIPGPRRAPRQRSPAQTAPAADTLRPPRCNRPQPGQRPQTGLHHRSAARPPPDRCCP